MTNIKRINIFDNIYITWFNKINTNFEKLNLEKLDFPNIQEETINFQENDYLIFKRWWNFYKIKKSDLLFDNTNTQKFEISEQIVATWIEPFTPVYKDFLTWIWQSWSLLTPTPEWFYVWNWKIVFFWLINFEFILAIPWKYIYMNDEWGLDYEIWVNWVKIWKFLTETIFLVDMDVENNNSKNF